MLNNLGDLKDEFLIRIQGSTSIAFYTEGILNDWVNQAHRFAATYRKWPMTEGRISTTLALGSNDEQNYPEGWATDSIRILRIGEKMYQKTNFQDFLQYREDSAAGEDRIFSDFGRVLYVNPNGASGTMECYGQFLPATLDVTLPSDTTIFSSADELGNFAILELMLSYAKTREKKMPEAQGHFQNAIAILEKLAKSIGDEQFAYHAKNREMFERMDVTGGNFPTDWRENRLY